MNKEKGKFEKANELLIENIKLAVFFYLKVLLILVLCSVINLTFIYFLVGKLQ